MRRSTRKQTKPIEWNDAPDIKDLVLDLLSDSDETSKILVDRLFFFRSINSKTRSYARIWGLSKLWQRVLKVKPTYIIEVISEYFDSLPILEKKKVLLHEIAHIPKNFSGALVPHIRKRGKRNFEDKVEALIAMYLKKR